VDGLCVSSSVEKKLLYDGGGGGGGVSFIRACMRIYRGTRGTFGVVIVPPYVGRFKSKF
jgi:hypothetical protein